LCRKGGRPGDAKEMTGGTIIGVRFESIPVSKTMALRVLGYSGGEKASGAVTRMVRATVTKLSGGRQRKPWVESEAGELERRTWIKPRNH